jgi:hypothetical protein
VENKYEPIKLFVYFTVFLFYNRKMSEESKTWRGREKKRRVHWTRR